MKRQMVAGIGKNTKKRKRNRTEAEKFRRRLLSLARLIGTIKLVIKMEIDYVAIGLRISKRRIQVGIKQNVLAEQIGISNNYLSSIERGKEKPSLEIIIKICNSLKVTPDYILMGNMYSNIVPQNIVQGLQLCSEEDIQLLNTIMQHMIDRRCNKWNGDNYA